MTNPLLGPKLKIERAYRHLVDLERAEREFFEQNPASLDIEVDPKTGDKLAKVRIKAPPPEMLHVISGELIYQLRSSLDQIAVALARLSVNPTTLKKIYFPTGEGRKALKDFKGQIRHKLAGVDRDLIKEVIRLRPYEGGNENLRAVFPMANVDKHTELIPVASFGSLSGLSNFEFVMTGESGLVIGAAGSLIDGLEICNLGPDGRVTPKGPNAQVRVSGQIVLGNVPAYEGLPLIPFLRGLCDSTAEAYDRILDRLVKTGRVIQYPDGYFAGSFGREGFSGAIH